MCGFQSVFLVAMLINLVIPVHYVTNECIRDYNPAISTVVCHNEKKCPLIFFFSLGNCAVFSILYENSLHENGNIFWMSYIYMNVGGILCTSYGTYIHNIIAGNIFFNMICIMYHWCLSLHQIYYVYPLLACITTAKIVYNVVLMIHVAEVPEILKEEAFVIFLFVMFYTNNHFHRSTCDNFNLEYIYNPDEQHRT